MTEGKPAYMHWASLRAALHTVALQGSQPGCYQKLSDQQSYSCLEATHTGNAPCQGKVRCCWKRDSAIAVQLTMVVARAAR